MFKGDTIPGLVSIGTGILFLIPSIRLGYVSSTSDGVQGAGFFPLMMSAVLIVCGIIILVKSIVEKEKNPYFQKTDETKENMKSFVITLMMIVVFLLIWKFVSFLVAAIILTFSLNRLYKRTLKYSFIFSVILVAIIYVSFNVLLHIQFII